MPITHIGRDLARKVEKEVYDLVQRTTDLVDDLDEVIFIAETAMAACAGIFAGAVAMRHPSDITARRAHLETFLSYFTSITKGISMSKRRDADGRWGNVL